MSPTVGLAVEPDDIYYPNLLANYELAKTYDEWGKRDQAIPFWKKVQELGRGKSEYAAITAEASKALESITR